MSQLVLVIWWCHSLC